jgi:hypothetical protein
MRLIARSGAVLAAVVVVALPLAGQEKKDKAAVTVDKEKRTVTVDCKIAPRKIDDDTFKGLTYPIEVMACWPFRKDPPGGQKAHETVVTFDFALKPSEIHKALESLGLKAGKPAVGDMEEPPQGPEVNILLEFTGDDGAAKRLPIEKALVSTNSTLKLPPFKWRFTGSAIKQPDPDKPDLKVYGADLTGTLISVFPVTDQTVFQTQMTMKEEKFIKLDTNKKVLPKEGTPAKLVIEAPPAKN